MIKANVNIKEMIEILNNILYNNVENRRTYEKIFGILMMLVLIMVTGCTKVGNYKEGLILGQLNIIYGSKYVTTALVYVDKDGLIKSCLSILLI